MVNLERVISLLISGIFMLSVAACQNRTIDSLHVLTNLLCELPCWNNITPNKTTVFEAEEILRTSNIVVKDSIFRQNLTGYEDPVIRWEFRSNGEGLIIVQNDQVLVIELNSNTRKGIGITLSEVIDVYGEPEAVFSAFNPDLPQWGTVSFLYPKFGVTVVYAAELENKKNRAFLQPETLQFFHKVETIHSDKPHPVNIKNDPNRIA